MKKLVLILLVLSVVFMSCSTEISETSSGAKTVTLIDVPAQYNGKYAIFWLGRLRNGSTDSVLGIREESADADHDLSNNLYLTQISDGKVIIPLQRIYGRGLFLAMEPYKGNDTFEDPSAGIYETPIANYSNPDMNQLVGRNLPPVSFSRGSATISWIFGEEWNSNISSVLAGSWYYDGQELFSIRADGTGSIKGQSGYSVEERYNPRETRFMQGGNVIGQFTFRLNGDGDMWITSGTGPFTSWANLGDNYRPFVIKKRKHE